MENTQHKKHTAAAGYRRQAGEYTFIDLSGRPDNSDWQAFIRQRLVSAAHFQIYCRNEESRQIALAEKYGQRTDAGWDWGVVVKGDVTDEFVNMLLSQPRPADRDIYKKMTPFFTIRFDNGCESGHWGTENYMHN